jgi:hypothetical protein
MSRAQWTEARWRKPDEISSAAIAVEELILTRNQLMNVVKYQQFPVIFINFNSSIQKPLSFQTRLASGVPLELTYLSRADYQI